MGDYKPSETRVADPGALPTGVRWQILGLLMAFAALGHFNRMSMSVAGTEHIMREYGISEDRMGLVYSAFLLVYTACMTPGGWLIDRVGARGGLIFTGFGLALFAVLTGLTGLVILTGSMLWAALLVIRGLAGAGSAPLHPAAARVASHWIPFRDRAWANGLITGSALVGIASTYYVFGSLIDRLGWQWAFVVTGLFTALLATVWTVYATDRPAQHPGVNASERQLIEAGDPFLQPAVAGAAPPDALGDTILLLRNRSLVVLTTSYAAIGYVQYMFFYWMQYYFDTVLELGKDKSRTYSTLLSLAMGAGMVLGGFLTDRLQAALGVRWGRALVPLVGLVISAVALVVGVNTADPNWVLFYLALTVVGIGATEGPVWTTAIDLGGRRGGTSAAICNTGGNMGGVVAPYLTPVLGMSYGWGRAMGVASVICLVGAVLWLWVDPNERVREDAAHS